MDKILKSAEKFAYSDKDIRNFLDDDVKIRKYAELLNCKSLDEIVDGKSSAVILYMTKQNYGHWTALVKDPGGEDNTYEVFDSYGIMPDDELKLIEDQTSVKLNGTDKTMPVLSYLIKGDLESKRVAKVYYNKYRLQKHMEDMNTCGRWCAVRCMLRRFRIDEFCLLFIKQKMEPDEYVTLLTLMNK